MLKKFTKITRQSEPTSTMISNQEGILTHCLIFNDASESGKVSIFIENNIKLLEVEVASKESTRIDLDLYISRYDIVKINSVSDDLNVVLNLIGDE